MVQGTVPATRKGAASFLAQRHLATPFESSRFFRWTCLVTLDHADEGNERKLGRGMRTPELRNMTYVTYMYR